MGEVSKNIYIGLICSCREKIATITISKNIGSPRTDFVAMVEHAETLAPVPAMVGSCL